MATIKRFEDILSWKKARVLNSKLGKLIDQGRLAHNYGLINQIERSAGSIMDNIAEGFERNGNREFLQFLYIAKGSCGELKSQLYRCVDRKYLDEKELNEFLEDVNAIIHLLKRLIDYLQSSELTGIKYKNRDKKSK